MRENRTYGSVRGASSDGRPYRDPGGQLVSSGPFADWNKVFPDQAMMIAAIDRLVHHSIIFEMNVESYRRRGAFD